MGLGSLWKMMTHSERYFSYAGSAECFPRHRHAFFQGPSGLPTNGKGHKRACSFVRFSNHGWIRCEDNAK